MPSTPNTVAQEIPVKRMQEMARIGKAQCGYLCLALFYLLHARLRPLHRPSVHSYIKRNLVKIPFCYSDFSNWSFTAMQP